MTKQEEEEEVVARLVLVGVDEERNVVAEKTAAAIFGTGILERCAAPETEMREAPMIIQLVGKARQHENLTEDDDATDAETVDVETADAKTE